MIDPRPAPRDLQAEPPYPDHATVVISIRDPYLVVHGHRRECPIEEPHAIKDCTWCTDA